MESFEEIIGAVIRKKAPKFQSNVGVVKSVEGNSCTLEREGMAGLHDVRLNAVLGDFEDYILITPKVGSEVMYMQVGGVIEENCIVHFTEIESVEIKIKDCVFLVKDGKIRLKNKETDLKDILSGVFNRLKTAVITTPSGPGKFSADDIAYFETQKQNILKLLS